MRCRSALAVALLVTCVGSCANTGESPVRVYRISAGDSLSAIARKLSVPGGVRALVELNGLARPNVIRDGDGLKVIGHSPQIESLPPFEPLRSPPAGLEACPATAWSPPVTWESGGEPDDPGLPETWACSEDGGFRVCANEHGAGLFAASGYLADGQRRFRAVATWPEEHFLFATSPLAAGTRADVPMEVTSMDLDGDGRMETVLATLSSVGVGMCVSSWNITIIENGRPTLHFSLKDYGEGSFVRRAGAGCDLLATRWAPVTGQMRGEALHFTGAFFRYAHGALSPAPREGLTCNGPHVPRLALRYGDFPDWDEPPEDENRTVLSDIRRRPLSLLTSTPAWIACQAEERAWDPPAEERVGRVIRVRADADAPGGARVLGRLDTGEEIAFPPEARNGEDSGSVRLRFGNERTALYFPDDYLPEDLTTLEGKELRMVALGAASWKHVELWIAP